MLLIGCNLATSTPTKVVKDFHAAVEKGDTKAFPELMTPKAAEFITPFAEKAKGQAQKEGKKIANTKETIDGDKAVVEVTYEDGETSKFDLLKLEGKWKIDIKK
jgi:ketosteroid isomerase-like protein